MTRDDLLKQLRAELGCAEPSWGAKGKWADLLRDVGLPEKNPDAPLASIQGIYDYLRMGRYFNFEITFPLRVYSKRNKKCLGTKTFGGLWPYQVERATIKTRDKAKQYITLTNLSAGSVPKDTYLAFYHRPSYPSAPGDEKFQRLLIFSNDLKRILHILRFESTPRAIRSGWKTYLSRGAVVYNVSQVLLALSAAGEEIWKAEEAARRNTKHPLYSPAFCIRVITDALNQVFQECYDGSFPWKESKLFNEIREDARKKNPSHRIGFLAAPTAATEQEFLPGSPSPLSFWKDGEFLINGGILSNHLSHERYLSGKS